MRCLYIGTYISVNMLFAQHIVDRWKMFCRSLRKCSQIRIFIAACTQLYIFNVSPIHLWRSYSFSIERPVRVCWHGWVSTANVNHAINTSQLIYKIIVVKENHQKIVYCNNLGHVSHSIIYYFLFYKCHKVAFLYHHLMGKMC